MMDMIAEALGRDPLEYREFNVLHDGDAFATGETVHDMHYRARLACFGETRARRRGKNLARVDQRTGRADHPTTGNR